MKGLRFTFMFTGPCVSRALIALAAGLVLPAISSAATITFYPAAGNGASNQWTPTGASVGADTLAIDGTASTAAGGLLGATLALDAPMSITTGSGTINSVTLTAYMKSSGGGTEQFQLYGTAAYTDATIFSPGTSYATYSVTLPLNPNTGVAWTWATVSGLRMGTKGTIPALGTHYVDQLSMTVDYVPSTATAANSTIAVSSTTVPADGSTSLVTIVLRDVFGNPVPNIAAQFSASGGATANQPALVTDANGTAYGSVSSTAVVSSTLNISTPALGGSPSATVNFVVGAAAQLVFTATPGASTAGNSLVSLPVVQIEDSMGRLITTGPDSTANVTLSLGPLSTGTLNGTLTMAASGGVADFSSFFIWIDLAGSKTLVATKAATTATGSFSVRSASFTVSAGAPSASTSAIAVVPASGIYADGVSQAKIVAALRDAYGNPCQGVTVQFAANPGGGFSLVQPTVVTNAQGVTSGSMTATSSGTWNVSISNPGGLNTVATNVTFVAAGVVSAANSTIAGSGPVVANGSATSTITIGLRDATNTPVVGVVPSFYATDTGFTNVYGACSASDVTGTSTCSLTSKTAESKTLTLSAPVTKSGGAVTFSAGPAAYVCMATQPGGAVAGNLLTPQPKTSVCDAYGNKVISGPDANAAVYTGLYTGSTGTLYGTASGPSEPPYFVTAAAGSADFTSKNLYVDLTGIKQLAFEKADTTAGGGTPAAYGLSARFEITPDIPSSLQTWMEAVPDTGIPADGVTTAIIHVIVLDAWGNPVPNTRVQITDTTGSGDIITQPYAMTDSGGMVTGYIASKVAEIKQLSISAPGSAAGIGPIPVEFVVPTTPAASIYTFDIAAAGCGMLEKVGGGDGDSSGGGPAGGSAALAFSWMATWALLILAWAIARFRLPERLFTAFLP